MNKVFLLLFHILAIGFKWFELILCTKKEHSIKQGFKKACMPLKNSYNAPHPDAIHENILAYRVKMVGSVLR
ncbi:hypothetical protein BSR56_15890 [Acinetobacter haemolyticus]|nr:hypothetical protein BSR56_15890 [Acinetobacter haemolyticus]